MCDASDFAKRHFLENPERVSSDRVPKVPVGTLPLADFSIGNLVAHHRIRVHFDHCQKDFKGGHFAKPLAKETIRNSVFSSLLNWHFALTNRLLALAVQKKEL
jgi:hypothetical protein